MFDAFVAGGLGMYPTLIAGLALLLASLGYAVRPQSRYLPLVLSLGLFTLFAGALGFLTSVMHVLSFLGSVNEADRSVILVVGMQESMYNLVLALLMTMLSALAASVGAWRMAQQVKGEAASARS